jgi:hypothetical protein
MATDNHVLIAKAREVKGLTSASEFAMSRPAVIPPGS